ncbi:PTS lactose/cellobiose transporter subunit IIA [Oenococcus sp. UCMA 17063]|nr:PTS lactose/cellobiose transporter subunit IIA [Oenococcus sp. UCMA 17063]
MNEAAQMAAMGLIINGGNAKSSSMEAIQSAKLGDFEAADKKLLDAESFLATAHDSQTSMLANDARVFETGKGQLTQVSLLMVHAQDHLMNAITFLDLAKEIVEVYKRLAK